MATHSIGSGGSFSTPQLWEDDIPATLTEPRVGQLKNQEFSVSIGPVIEFSAHTTSSGNFILLECESGASFKDNANVRTNALRYNASNGAGLKVTSQFYVIRISGACNHLTIRGVQAINTGNAYNNAVFAQSSSGSSTNLLVQDCIFEATIGGTFVVHLAAGTSGVKFVNCLVIQRSGSSHGFDSGTGGTTEIIGCTIVAPSNNTSSGSGIDRVYGTTIAKNTAIFGFASDVTGGLDSSSDYNATSLSDAGSGLPDPTPDHNVYNLTYTSQFEQSSDSGGAHDFRAKSGGGLENAGLLDSTNSPNDITGLARGTPPEIGVWELLAGAPGGYYLLETGVDRFLLEDSSGLLLLEETDPFPIGYLRNYQNTLIRM